MSGIDPRLLLVFLLPFAIIGCQQPEEEQPKEVVRPVKTVLIASPEAGGMRNFPGRIDTSRRADLAFRIPGKVSELPVKEGDRVRQGQVVAQLDPKDYQTIVNERQATYEAAKADYDRAKQLVKKGFLSRRDYDQVEAKFKNASALLEQTKLNLSYTVLKAPFAGDIAKRLIQRFEEVEAKQPVLALRDTSVLEVKFDVPQTIMLRLLDDAVEPDVFVSFESAKGKRYKLRFKEIATKADAKTQTFEVTYVMPAPDDLVVLPGMAASVSVDLSQYLGRREIYYVPVSAVVGDITLSPEIWVVDETSMTVAPKSITVGKMRAHQIEVSEGVSPGDRVVVAGTPFLVEGMKVRLMPDFEQAEEISDSTSSGKE